MVDFADTDIMAADFQRRGGQPGFAYGIVIDSELMHAAGFGELCLGGPAPDADTVFRIASMTKSFTASAVLALRDDGALRLDDPAEVYVPELRGWPRVTPDSGPVSLRHLLTMTAGFPTDDPWGDRQQGMPLEEFAAFLAGGVSFARAPGVGFEYSNLGYAILGRVITAVTGAAYQDYVRDRLLRPLGMTRTGFEATEFTTGLAHGYRRAPDGWSQVAFEPCGAFAPMGGIFSCVRDLTRWVDGFAAAFPPGDAGDREARHPVRPATRREMQLAQVLTGWDKPGFPGETGPLLLSAYGFGLFVGEHPSSGRVVSHSGGYPGFGSNMRWHPGTRTGVIALGNGTYSAMQSLAARILPAVLERRQEAVQIRPWPQTIAARDKVSRLLQSWDEAEAARLFSPNVAQDTPLTERRDDADRLPEFDTAAHCRWWLAGERGVVQVQIQLTPEREPRVQSLTLAVPPAPGSPLRATLDALLAWLNGTDRDWPLAIAVSDTVEVGLLARRLRMAAAWAGECRLEAWKAGDGAASTTVDLTGDHAPLTLSLLVDPPSGTLRQLDILP